MKRRTQPAALPRSFRGIWEALKEADENAASRQALARELGVATHTLQRILVRGDVPSFARGTNNRIRRAWARTLARLAKQLGHEPRDWIEAAGIRWSEDIERAVEAALRGRITREPASARRPVARGRSAVEPIRVAIARGLSLAAPLPLRGASFLEIYARRLIGTIEPGRRIEVAMEDEAEIVAKLWGRAPVFEAGAGVVDTIARRASGLRLEEIPGWRARVGGFALKRRGAAARAPHWREVESRRERAAVLALDEIARQFFVVQRGFSREEIPLVAPGADLAIEVTSLLEASAAEVVIVAGLEWSWPSARDSLRAQGAARFAVQDLPGAESGPSYPIAMAVRADAPAWAGLIGAAREQEVFGSAAEETARLYAEVAAAGQAPAHFSGASPAFQAAFCARLLELLAGESGSAAEPSSLAERANEVAARAERIVPREWREALDAAAGRYPAMHAVETPSAAGGSRFCRSCSVSLSDEHNRGVSDRYCRYCSDEHGRLKPRVEVRRLIAGWISEWQGGVGEKESLERADRLMSAMPAWSRN